MLTGRFQLAPPGDEAADQDGGRPRLRSARRRPGRRRRTGRAARPGCRPTTPRAEVRYRDPTQMGKIYLPPGRRRAADPRPRRTRAGPGCRRPGADPRRLARADPPPSGRAQEPAAQPGVRRRHRQRLQRRDPPRRAAAAVPQARRASRPRRSTRSTTRRGRRWRRRSTSCASGSRRRSRSRFATSSRSTTRAASRARAAGRGSPRSAPAASSRRTAGAASAERRAAAATARSSGDLQDLADLEARRVADAVQLWIALRVVPNAAAMPTSVSPALTLYVCAAPALGGAGEVAGAARLAPSAPVATGGRRSASVAAVGGRIAGVGRGEPAGADDAGRGEPIAADAGAAAGEPRERRARRTRGPCRTTRTAWPVDRSERRIGTRDREPAVVEDDRRRASHRARQASARGRDRSARAARAASKVGARRVVGGQAQAALLLGGERRRRCDRAAAVLAGDRRCCARRRRRRRGRDRCGSTGRPVAGAGRRTVGGQAARAAVSTRGHRVKDSRDRPDAACATRARMAMTRGNAKILATTYFPERLPSQYLRRWRA